jgi:hypothetical protein
MAIPHPLLPAIAALIAASTLPAQRIVREFFGTTAIAEFGASLARTPDGNGDGRADLLVGVPRLPNGSMLDAGGAVLFATSTGAVLATAAGNAGGSRLGSRVTCAGDLDGNGSLDLVIAGPFASAQDGVVQATRLDGSLLWRRTGVSGTRLGWALAPLNDVNADGRPDLMISAPLTVIGTLGDVGACAGNTGAALTSVGGSAYGDFGSALVALGDMNNDGRIDVASSEPFYSGGIGRVSLLSPLQSGGAAVIWTTGAAFAAGENVGQVMGNAGDLTGDGKNDLLVSSTQGRVHVLDGATGAVLGIVPWTHYANATSLAGIGDQNGDGVPEFAIGQSAYNSQTGRVAVHDGASWNLLYVIDGQSGSRFGAAIAPLDDLDGDGAPEFAIGAPLHFHAGQTVGRVSVHGRTVQSALVQYGAACGGGNALVMVGTGTPVPGQGFGLSLTPVPVGRVGLWLYGNSRTTSAFGPLPLDLGLIGATGCLLHQSTEASFVFVSTAAGPVTTATSVPNNQTLVGVKLFAQATLLEPGAAGGLLTSNGIEVRIGNQ